jgi:Dyp-type peroxidase family
MNLDLADIQGIVFFGYAAFKHARYVHVSFEDERSRPNTWLGELAPEVHGSGPKWLHGDHRVQVALTHRGLARLALDRTELASFPRELQQGMHDELRAHVLGDTGPNDPKNWDFGGPNQSPIHALLLLYAKSADAIAALRERLVERVGAHGGKILHEDTGELREPLLEPFGFRDGLVQPRVAGSPRPPSSRSRPVETGEAELAAGEVVLGYPNAYNELPPSPRGKDDFDIGKNGSYLVYRKLQQDTSGFWQHMLERAEPKGDLRAATKLASCMVGRWPSGAPLVSYPHDDPGPEAAKETFNFFREDPDGMKCPFGAHVRRANPRDMLAPSPEESIKAVDRHRLVRRGRPYGPPATGTPAERARWDGRERGLVFMALNASFRRQFEFVQQTWVNNPKFAGLDDERDPLVAGNIPAGGQCYTIPDSPARRRIPSLPAFVTVRGGGYFFLPGLRALDWLAKRRPPAHGRE